jgi:AAA15 family ATPase/GTPase
MLRSLKIENFRCFPSFELKKLGRVNLLVGKNNSGKTSILEGINLFYSQRKVNYLGEILNNRGEYIIEGSEDEFDIRHLFYGHEVDLKSEFSITGLENESFKKLIVSLEYLEYSQLNLFNEEKIKFSESLTLNLKWTGIDNRELKFSLSSNGGLNINYWRNHRLFRERDQAEILTQFVGSSSLTYPKMIELFDQVVLTPNEKLVIEALQKIEPNIERIASVKSTSRSRTGFLIKMSDSDQRLPIGGMGDGILRILGLTLAIVNAKGGVLLVDEIDTGLHFTAMYDMWKLIYETAKRLNVQVFATTHSRDCWESLAEIAETEDSSENDIVIHRIEKGRANSIVIGEDEMAIAAERGIEVR